MLIWIFNACYAVQYSKGSRRTFWPWTIYSHGALLAIARQEKSACPPLTLMHLVLCISGPMHYRQWPSFVMWRVGIFESPPAQYVVTGIVWAGIKWNGATYQHFHLKHLVRTVLLFLSFVTGRPAICVITAVWAWGYSRVLSSTVSLMIQVISVSALTDTRGNKVVIVSALTDKRGNKVVI